jgi:hypothetical protein
MPGSLRTTPQHIAAVGLTVDGREITEQDIDDIVETYNPELYGARINLDHYGNWGGWAADDLSIDLDGCMLGDVISVAKGNAEDGTAVLTAILCPNASLLKLNQADQAVYYSIEINRNFMGEDKTYLTGLAMTDYPASTRTTRAKFSVEKANEHQNKQVQKIALAIEPEQKNSFINKFSNLFSSQKDDEMKPEQFSQLQTAITEPLTQLAASFSTMQSSLASIEEKFSNPVTPLEADTGASNEDESDKENQAFTELQNKHDDLQEKFSKLEANFAKAKITPADDTTEIDDDHQGESCQFGKDFL